MADDAIVADDHQGERRRLDDCAEAALVLLDGKLVAPALRNVRVHGHRAAARHRIALDLERTTIRQPALEVLR